MELKFVCPNMEKTFGVLEFAGVNEVVQRRVNGVLKVTAYKFNLFSSVQRADDIIVEIPASAGEKNFEYEQVVKLVNPQITAVGNKIGNNAYPKYVLKADDMVAIK